eukprot:CAMPEP_0118975356 /NCGR_PEP_ID=MMETSP1173-20130426/15433_1 /TAXON_ID=1034831 /ORGANISM="Rhizochromulina marina cf, Strain CCMP1243" /LENGTH=173 /DNA_ID=CAMNT_0006925229 /DNA_START=100 /DNA_END=622 /DNA_ORIENTATION=+
MRNVDHPPRGGPSVGVLVLAWNGGACGVRRPPFVSLTPLSTSSLSLGTRRTTARPPSIIKPPLLSCCLATPDRPALCCVCGCVVFYARARQPRIFFEIPLKKAALLRVPRGSPRSLPVSSIVDDQRDKGILSCVQAMLAYAAKAYKVAAATTSTDSASAAGVSLCEPPVQLLL